MIKFKLYTTVFLLVFAMSSCSKKYTCSCDPTTSAEGYEQKVKADNVEEAAVKCKEISEGCTVIVT